MEEDLRRYEVYNNYGEPIDRTKYGDVPRKWRPVGYSEVFYAWYGGRKPEDKERIEALYNECWKEN
jgi:hypothetical protein